MTGLYSKVYWALILSDSRTDLQKSMENLSLQSEGTEFSLHRSTSCSSLSLVLRNESQRENGSRPSSFASLPNEGTGRSVDSSRGSWDLETRYDAQN